MREVILVTTLLDAQRFPAAALARLYESRWQAETNLGHLKQTLGLDVLRSQTESGILKEMLGRSKAAGLGHLAGDDAFKLYDTFGFPLELTQEVAHEAGSAPMAITSVTANTQSGSAAWSEPAAARTAPIAS